MGGCGGAHERQVWLVLMRWNISVLQACSAAVGVVCRCRSADTWARTHTRIKCPPPNTHFLARTSKPDDEPIHSVNGELGVAHEQTRVEGLALHLYVGVIHQAAVQVYHLQEGGGDKGGSTFARAHRARTALSHGRRDAQHPHIEPMQHVIVHTQHTG